MHFPGRELKPYAEPVVEDSLVSGQIYFAVQFLDPEMLVPTLVPLVFLGPDLEEPGPVRRLLFQDAGSYRAGVRSHAANHSGVVFYSQAEGQCNHLFEFEQALEVLLACSLRRESRGRGMQAPPAGTA
jgi:hypothetical protein